MVELRLQIGEALRSEDDVLGHSRPVLEAIWTRKTRQPRRGTHADWLSGRMSIDTAQNRLGRTIFEGTRGPAATAHSAAGSTSAGATGRLRIGAGGLARSVPLDRVGLLERGPVDPLDQRLGDR